LFFSNDDLAGITTPYDDPLVIHANFANHNVLRILMDNGSSVDVLSLKAFKKMNLSRDGLKPIRSPLVRFTGDVLDHEGLITLPVTLGEAKKHVTMMVDFLVVKMP
ncbi:hypothetical protein CFOL_v3_09390, partial [Cephalotus follicularis]